MWAGAIPPRELVGGRASGQANGRMMRSVVPHLVVLPTSPPCRPNPSPCRRCLADVSPHTVAASPLCHPTPSPPRCHRRYRRRRCRRGDATAAAIASPPPPLWPSHRRLRRYCPAPLPPHCHPRVATSAAVTTSAAIALASPRPPPSPARCRGRDLVMKHVTRPLPGDATPIVPSFA